MPVSTLGGAGSSQKSWHIRFASARIDMHSASPGRDESIPRSPQSARASRTPQKPPIGPVVVGAPGLETSLLVELIRKVDVGPAVQQIPQVQSRSEERRVGTKRR